MSSTGSRPSGGRRHAAPSQDEVTRPSRASHELNGCTPSGSPYGGLDSGPAVDGEPSLREHRVRSALGQRRALRGAGQLRLTPPSLNPRASNAVRAFSRIIRQPFSRHGALDLDTP